MTRPGKCHRNDRGHAACGARTRGWKAAGIALSIMPLIGALADGVLSWGETTFLAVVGLVFIGVVMVGLTRIMLRRLAKPRSAAAVRRGGSRALRAMTWLLIVGYVGLVAVLTTYGRDLPWFLWIALVIWVIGMLGLTIMQSRAENLLSDNARPRAEFGFYTALFIVGVGLLGLGAATIGVAVNALRRGDWFIFATVGVEAVAIVLVGALVLTARHIVVALGLLGLGIVAVGFGVGSIVGGDALFGSGVVTVGGATLLSAAATARLSDPWTALAYFVTGAACPVRGLHLLEPGRVGARVRVLPGRGRAVCRDRVRFVDLRPEHGIAVPVPEQSEGVVDAALRGDRGERGRGGGGRLGLARQHLA